MDFFKSDPPRMMLETYLESIAKYIIRDGYQVPDQWLCDRRERKLSNEEIRHNCRVATALYYTINLQKKIRRGVSRYGRGYRGVGS